MSEEAKAVSFQQASPVVPEPEAPEYLTKAEALELIERASQSFSDKASSRLEKRMQERLQQYDQVIAAQKAAGIPLTDEQIKQARNEIITSTYTQAPEAPATVTTAPAAQPLAPVTKAQPAQQPQPRVEGVEDAIYEEFGVQLTTDDPEAAGLDMTSQKAFYKTLREAVAKKAQRINTPAAARIPTMGTNAPAPGLLQQYEAELAKIRNRSDVNALIALKQKYRAAGLKEI